MQNIMVDIETLGLTNNCVVTTIGAVSFDETGLGLRFYVSMINDLDYQVNQNRIVEPSSVMWWLQQGDAARAGIYAPPLEYVKTTKAALDAFARFMTDVQKQNHGERPKIWGYGAAFDNAILRSLYEATGRACPFSYRDDMCYRTLKALYPQVKEPVRMGTHHNSLDDAVHQAEHASAILRAMRAL